MNASLHVAPRVRLPPRRYRCGPSWTLDLELEDYDLWFIHAGRGQVRRAGQTITLRPGDALVFFPGHRILGTQDLENPLDVTAIHFDYPSPALLEPLQELKPVRPSWPNLFETWLSHATSLAAFEADWQPTCEHLLACAILDLLRYPSRFGEPRHASAFRALASEIYHSPEQTWTIEKMCAITHVSRSALHEGFLAMFSVSPIAFVIAARLETAESLLRESQLTVSEIAEALGYRDVFYFSRQFKRERGISPSAFRRLSTGDSSQTM